MAVTNTPSPLLDPAPPSGGLFGGNMVAKNKIHGRRMRQPLQQLHNRCFFQQLAVSPPGTKYVSVTAGTKTWLIHIVTSEDR